MKTSELLTATILFSVMLAGIMLAIPRNELATCERHVQNFQDFHGYYVDDVTRAMCEARGITL